MTTVEPGAGPTYEERSGALPNVVVIGGQKCGTSSLHNYLDAHPEITMSRPKELNFFGGPGFANWDRGLDWYRGRFSPEAPVRGESSPSYTAYPFVSDVPRRMHAVIPEAKLVYLVRDPIDRLVSQYVHLLANGEERRPFAQIFADRPPEHTGYVLQSSYWLQLRQYLEHYPAEQILVVDQSELDLDRARTMARVFAFLGVDDLFDSPVWAHQLNRSGGKRRPRRLLGGPGGRASSRLLRRLPEPAASPLTKLLTAPIERPTLDGVLHERLAGVLRPDAERLREHTGHSFSGWSV